MTAGGARVKSREEVANVLSHGLGLAAAIAATPILVVTAVARGGAADIVGSSIFGATMIVLYFASTSFHAAPEGRWRDRLQKLDHAAIYLLIAGTYTPFTLGVLGGAWGWTLFGIVWGVAAVGVFVKLAAGSRGSLASTVGYLVMGWLVVVAIVPLTQRMAWDGLFWLVSGGVLYSAGAAFYSARSVPYGHFVWHVLVLAGSACHFIAVLGPAV